MTDKRRLIGIVRPLESIPCFGFPVFSATGNDLSLQVIDDGDRISAFAVAEVLPSAIHPQPSHLVRAVGNEAVYAFFSSGANVSLGSRRSISRLLRSMVEELTHPFLLSDIAAFLGDSALMEEATKRGAQLLWSAGIPSAHGWHGQVMARANNLPDSRRREQDSQLTKDRLMQSIVVAFLRGAGPNVEVAPSVVDAIRARYYNWIDTPTMSRVSSPLDVWEEMGDDLLGRFKIIGRIAAHRIRGNTLGVEEFLFSASAVEQESDCPYCPSL